MNRRPLLLFVRFPAWQIQRQEIWSLKEAAADVGGIWIRIVQRVI